MSHILLDRQGPVALLTISRPEALNALNSAVLAELEGCLDLIDADVRCVVLTGAGEKAFVAGADIAEMKDMDPDRALAFARTGNRVFSKLERLSVPVIAAVNGYALGGGCELALCCDIRVATESAVFAQPEVSLGITPGFGGTQRLPRLIGLSAAKRMIYTGRRVKAQEALALGLVDVVVPKEELLKSALELANEIAANVPFAVRASKKAIGEGMDLPLDEALEGEAALFSRCFTTRDRQNAMTAFVEKRKPEPFENA